jgi:hypothetical protein
MKITAPKLNRSKLRPVVERYPLPEDVNGICELIRDILDKGSVQKIELDVGDLVRVVRLVEVGDLEESEEGWDQSLKGLEDFEEYNDADATPDGIILHLLNAVADIDLFGVAFITGTNDTNLLGKWLKIPDRSKQIAGIPIYRVNTLPEETLVLCGAKFREATPSEIEYAIKTTMEIRHEERKLTGGKITDSGRDNPGRYSETNDQLEIAPGRLRKVRWESKVNRDKLEQPSDVHGEPEESDISGDSGHSGDGVG